MTRSPVRTDGGFIQKISHLYAEACSGINAMECNPSSYLCRWLCEHVGGEEEDEDEEQQRSPGHGGREGGADGARRGHWSLDCSVINRGLASACNGQQVRFEHQEAGSVRTGAREGPSVLNALLCCGVTASYDGINMPLSRLGVEVRSAHGRAFPS